MPFPIAHVPDPGPERRRALIALLGGLVAALVWFWATAHIGFDLEDEGYVWYGAQRTALGEVALRDFMSYDVGRYAYLATVFRFVGDDGIMTLRAAAYAVFAPALALVLWLVLDATGSSGLTPCVARSSASPRSASRSSG